MIPRFAIDYRLKHLLPFCGRDDQFYNAINGGYTSGITAGDPGFHPDCEPHLGRLGDIVPEEYTLSHYARRVLVDQSIDLDAVAPLRKEIQDVTPDHISVSGNDVTVSTGKKKKKNKKRKKRSDNEDEEDEDDEEDDGDEPIRLTTPKPKKRKQSGSPSDLSKKDLKLLSTMLKNIGVLVGGLFDMNQMNELLVYLMEKKVITQVVPDQEKLAKLFQEDELGQLPIGLKELDNVRKIAKRNKSEYDKKERKYQKKGGEAPEINKKNWKDQQYIVEAISVRGQAISGIPFPPYPEHAICTESSGNWKDFHIATQTNEDGEPTTLAKETIQAMRAQSKIPGFNGSIKRRPSMINTTLDSDDSDDSDDDDNDDDDDDIKNSTPVVLESAFNNAASTDKDREAIEASGELDSLQETSK